MRRVSRTEYAGHRIDTNLIDAPERYDSVTRLLHWVFAVGIIYASIVGYALGWIADPSAHDFFSHLNMSLATVLMALFPVRVAWRFIRAEPASPAIDPRELRLAKGVQSLIYLAIAAVLISGFLMVPHSYALFGTVTVPTVFEKGPMTEAFFLAHRIGCASLVGLVLLHGMGVVKHTLIKPVGLLRRMV